MAKKAAAKKKAELAKKAAAKKKADALKKAELAKKAAAKKAEAKKKADLAREKARVKAEDDRKRKQAAREKEAQAKARLREKQAAEKARLKARAEAEKIRLKEKAEREKQRAAEAAARAAAKAAAEAEKVRAREEAAAAKAAAKAAAEAEKARLKAEAEAKKKAEAKKFTIIKGPSEDGITSTKEFDLKFLFAQRDSLRVERAKLLGQADRLEDEANALIADAEMGDVQFDDEGGEGDTMVVERERDQVLSAQARQTVAEIDAALERMSRGEYGYSSVSGFPIPKERLKALPWATELVTERAGGLGRR